MIQSCDSQKDVLKNVPEDKLTETFTLKTGDTLRIELKSNPSTGYAWSTDNKIKPKVIKELGREFVQDKKSAGLIGAGGTDVWSFVAIKKGETYLHFVYSRQEDVNKEKFYKVSVE